MSSPGPNGRRIQPIIHSTSNGFVHPWALPSMGPIWECAMPHQLSGMAIANPANGPLMAMSNIALRSPAPAFWTMTAPMVPIGLIGMGMKIGRLAGT